MTRTAADPTHQAARQIAAASGMAQAGRRDEARVLLHDLVAAHPDEAEAHAALARFLLDDFEFAAAEPHLLRCIALAGETPDRLWPLAMAQRRQRRFEPAADSFARFLDLAAADDPRRHEAHTERLHVLRKLRRHAEAEAAARAAAAAFPADGDFIAVIGESLLMQGREAEAESVLERALEVDPQQTESRALLRAIRAGRAGSDAPDAQPIRTRAWPTSLPRLGDVRQVIRSSLLAGYPQGGRFITPESRFLTMGSCFAINLAKRLRAAGYATDSEFVGEEVNSTYANRYLLEWVEKGAVDAQTEAMEEAYGEGLRERFRASFAACDVFVFTLGLAPCFFSRASGDFFFMAGRSPYANAYLRRTFEMRTTSVAENQANIAAIVDSVRRLARPDARIVLSVSPAPLGATSEFASPVIADCVSKSTLRIACHEAMKTLDPAQVSYWPSFEMVRWLGGHFGHDFEPAFARDDGNSRHVSTWLVDAIIDLFLETYSQPPQAGGAAPADA